MSVAGPVYLIGSSHGATVREVFARVNEAHGQRPLEVAVSFAALPDGDGVARAKSFAKTTFPHARVEHFSVTGESDAMPSATARSIVERADVLFFGGGDPVLAMRRLVEAGADTWVRAARERGAACVGLSAGSIALGAYWASWPDDDPDAEPNLVRGIAAVADLVVDCHAENDDWEELHAVRARLGPIAAGLTFAGIGHGSALVVHGDGALEWLGRSHVLTGV